MFLSGLVLGTVIIIARLKTIQLVLDGAHTLLCVVVLFVTPLQTAAFLIAGSVAQIYVTAPMVLGQFVPFSSSCICNFACFPKALPLVCCFMFPKALPLGQGMLGLQPVDRAGMVIVQDKIVGTQSLQFVTACSDFRKGVDGLSFATIIGAKNNFGSSSFWNCHCEPNDCILNGQQDLGVWCGHPMFEVQSGTCFQRYAKF